MPPPPCRATWSLLGPCIPGRPTSQVCGVPSRASPGARRVCPFLADLPQARSKHSATAPSPGKRPGGAGLQGRPGWPGAQPWPGSSRPPLCPPAWGLQPPQLPPSFPCSPGHNERPRGVPAVTLPQAGWSRPSFPLTLCFPRAGGQASCSPGPSLHASGHGVTSKCGRGARAPHPAPSLRGCPSGDYGRGH